jgi:SAM-dependent methyltransferase
MRDNVKHFLHLLAEVLDAPAPVVEIGALQTEEQESYADMRPLFRDRVFLGCDMRPGVGVECLTDAHRLPFRDGTVGTVLLLDTLEHLYNPSVAVDEACRVVREGGIVVLASVMRFPIHSFPSDYWRFTPAAFDYLLQPLPCHVVYSQGDAEFPHTVIGLGTQTAQGSEAGGAFRAAVQEIETRWPEMMHGGPLLRWQPSQVALAQRLDERRLPGLERGRRITQSFVCPSDNLSRVDVKMWNPGPPNLSHILFRLCEEGEQQREIASYRLLAPHIMEGAWTFIPVPLQENSAGRRYLLMLESPDGDPGEPVSAFASNDTVYEDGQLLVDGEPTVGSLCFQVHCRSSDKAQAAPRPEPRGEHTGRSAPGGHERRQPSSDEATERMLRAEEQRWEQVRYLASVIQSGFDALHADLKSTEKRLSELERLQREALEQSTEAAALVRSLRRNPAYRIWRRLFG